MKFTNSTLCTICIAFCICLSAMTLFPVAAAASDTAATDDFPSGPREYWQVMHNTTDEPPAIYEELWALPEEEQRERIEAMRVTPETRKWPVDKSPVVPVISISFDGAETFELTHPTDWWVSAINPVNNETGNYSEITIIPEIGPGDTIHVWGLPGHTYEGGFAITAADVTIQRWEGAPVMPVLTSPVNTTPAITITGNNATLSGLNVSGTSLSDGNGAGVSAMGTNVTPLEGLTIENCVISGNQAGESFIDTEGFGGGLYAVYITDFQLTDCVFSGNSAGTSGGGAYIQESPVDMQNCTFTENFADLHGGGAYFDASYSGITDTSFLKNDVNYGDGGGVMFRDGGATLTNTTISGNTASIFGGGVLMMAVDADIRNCEISGNGFGQHRSEYSDGGGAYFSDSNAILTDTQITFNSAMGSQCGGGVFQSCDVGLTNTLFHMNEGGYGAGGANFYGSTATIMDTKFLGNFADFFAGGITGISSDIILINSSVEKSIAMYAGGADIHESNITFIDSSLSENRAFERNGGMSIARSNLIMINTTVSKNSGFFYGGGISCDDCTATFTDTQFSDNQIGGGNGGAIHCRDSDMVFSNTVFRNNSASNGGSAVMAINCSSIHMTNSLIRGLNEDIVSAETPIDAENVTFDAFGGNSTTISCTGWNLGLGTAGVPSSGPDENIPIGHALLVTGINATHSEISPYYNSSCDLVMYYLDDDLGTVNESMLMLFSTNGTYWEPVPNATVNPDDNAISIDLSEADLPESVIDVRYYNTFNRNWTTLVPAGPASSTEETIALSLTTGWNMISSPFEEITSISVPPDVLVMYRYDAENGTYVLCDPSALCPCRGYWIGATAPCTVNITGIPLPFYSQNLSTGWNMIGCRCHPVPVEEIIITPKTTVYLYGYDQVSGQYQWITIADALQPGEGYWAGVGCCCILTEG